MLGLPESTELNKQLAKKAIYTKFSPSAAAKARFDRDIKKLVIVNEISPLTTAITRGDEVSSFFVLLVSLKTETYDEKNIALISRLIDQKMLFILACGDRAKLAIYYQKLMQTDWKSIDELGIGLKGLNLDMVWENIIMQVGKVQVEPGNTLDEQLKIDGVRSKINKKIRQLGKQARAEKQPKKKFELVQEIKKLEREIGGNMNG